MRIFVDFKFLKHEDLRAWSLTDLNKMWVVLYEPVGGVIVRFNYLSF